jgi:hypothetical protein
MTRPGYAISRPPAARKWLAVFALLSFILQSLAVQTHVHQQLPLTVAGRAEHQRLLRLKIRTR